VLLQHLSLREFRNFAAGDLDFGARFTVLHGPNGVGKTNILEALYLVATLRSFRSADLGPLVRHGASEARVEVSGQDLQLGLGTRLAVHLTRTARQTRRLAVADGKTVRSGPDFYGRLRAILFTPEDLGILRGSPTGRRQFLDRALFARDRAHIADIADYDKLLRSRNRVLRGEDAGISRSQQDGLLDAYDAGLAAAGARIWLRRERLLGDLRGAFAEAFAQIHGRHLVVTLEYLAKLAGEPASVGDPQLRLADALRAARRHDLVRGTTTVGPHRDDFEVRLDGQDAGAFASQGQARALILAFKIAELQDARARAGEAPVLLLDDVSSELDPQRSAQLFEALLREAGQCVLTTTAPHFIGLPAGGDCRYIEVDKGHIELGGDSGPQPV
jgi:DNA replication and repair protein RecF